MFLCARSCVKRSVAENTNSPLLMLFPIRGSSMSCNTTGYLPPTPRGGVIYLTGEFERNWVFIIQPLPLSVADLLTENMCSQLISGML